MARTRSIKPDFFTDADLTELSPLHRLLFAGLWCHADREGRLEDKPRELRVKILPFDECDVDAMLIDLARKGRIVRYDVAGRRLIAIPKFAKHQHCHRDEKESAIPAPPEVTPKPPEPFEHGIAIMAAPQEHRAPTVQAPNEHGASTPVICNLSPVSGSLSSGARSTVAPPAPGALRDGIEAEFKKQRGTDYSWSPADEAALRRRIGDGVPEILRRWAIALGMRYPKCSTVAVLCGNNWNEYAKAEEQTGPPRDVRKGRVGAEEIDKQAFAKTGTVHDF